MVTYSSPYETYTILFQKMSVQYGEKKRGFVLAVLMAKEKKQQQEMTLDNLMAITNAEALQVAMAVIELVHGPRVSRENSQQFADSMKNDMLLRPNSKQPRLLLK